MSKRHGFKYTAVGYHVKTMEKKQWPSVKAVAEWAGKSLNWANRRVREKVLWKGFLIGYESQEDAIRQAVAALQPKPEVQPSERKLKDETGYKSLRIDRHTVILVPQERACQEYIEYYLLKREGRKMPPFEDYLLQTRLKQ